MSSIYSALGQADRFYPSVQSVLNIAICEDQPEDMKLLTSYIQKYCKDHSVAVQLFPYGSSEELLEDKHFFDTSIVFFDIYMQQTDGIKAASILRKKDYEGSIVFTTTSKDRVFESFIVEPSDYLVKPISFEHFSFTMERLIKRNQNAKISLQVSAGKDCLSIPLKDIYSIETGTNHTIYIHIKNQTIKSTSTLSQIELQLKDYPQFLKCHRSYIINMLYVDYVDESKVYLQNGQTALIKTRSLASIKKEILHFLQQKSLNCEGTI